MSLGIDLLTVLVYGGEVKDYLTLSLEPHLFKPSEVGVFKEVDAHVKQYGVLPSKTLYQEVLDSYGKKVADIPTEVPEYYYDKVKERYTSDSLKLAMTNAAACIKNGSPVEALDKLSETVLDLLVTTTDHQIVDFRESLPILNEEYKKVIAGGGDYGIKTGWPHLDDMTGGLKGGDLISYIGRPGMGKYLPLDTPVLLESGEFVPNGTLKVGDRLASIDGKPSVVEALYPHKNKPMYEVALLDGRTITAGDEHLWEVTLNNKETKVLTTIAIKDLLTKGAKVSLPAISGDFGEESTVFGIDPWVFGYLMSTKMHPSGVFMVTDFDIAKRLQRDSHLVVRGLLEESGIYTVALQPNVVSLLRNIRYGTVDAEFPEDCFRLTKEGRLNLLAGVLDSSGWETNLYNIEVYNYYLADGLVKLCYSLGLQASIHTKDLRYSTAKKKIRLYVVSFTSPNIAKYTTSRFDKSLGDQIIPSSYIVSITPTKPADALCIKVSHERSLYIVGDYIPTHNTFNLLHTARGAWYEQKASTLIISMEMVPLPLIQRLTAMQTHSSLTMLKNAEFSTKKYNEVCGEMLALEGHEAPLWIVNGNLTATVEDIWALSRQLKPDLILVDGAYLVKTKEHMGKWERIGHVAEALKSEVATALDIPCIATYQFGRDAIKKKKDESVGLEDIYGSDSIGQVSSIVLGLLEDDGIETMQRRRVDILKGRNGEVGKFYINWDFWNMNFDQWSEDTVEDMQFL